MGKGNINEIPKLNYMGKLSFQHFSAHAHTNTYKLSTESSFWYSIPTRYCCCFLSRFQIFLFKEWVWSPELDLENAFGKEDENRSEGSRQPPLTRNTAWLGCWSPNQHWGPCWPQQSKDIKTCLSKGSTVWSLTWLVRWLVFQGILVRG